MADEKYTFEQARIRLEEIAAEVRKKDTSLEKSLDLLEEGVRLANICTELVDHPDVSASVPAPVSDVAGETDGEGASAGDEAPASEDAAREPAGEAADPEFDTDGFEDVDEPASASSEEDTQD